MAAPCNRASDEICCVWNHLISYYFNANISLYSKHKLVTLQPHNVCSLQTICLLLSISSNKLKPLDSKGNYSATSNNTKLVHWPLMGGLLHLVQREGAWAGCGPAQSPPGCTKCNSPPINGQCTNHCTAILQTGLPLWSPARLPTSPNITIIGQTVTVCTADGVSVLGEPSASAPLQFGTRCHISVDLLNCLARSGVS